MKPIVVSLALLVATPAAADIIHVTYSGTVVNGVDVLGFFGIPGASLTGDAYTASYTFNTGIGYIQSDPFYNSDLGGIGYAAPSPSLGASLMINGFNIFVSGISAANLYNGDWGSYSKTYQTAVDTLPGFTNYISNWMTDPTNTIPVSINASFNYSGIGQGQALYRNMMIDLLPTSVSVLNSSIPSVPEPSTWALMLFGFAFFAIKGIWPAWNRK